MSPRAVVYESAFSGERYEIDVPLECRVDLEALRAELGLPSYVSLDDPHVARAVAILWAASHLDQIGSLPAKVAPERGPLTAAVFGGVAFRFLCPSANPGGIFHRTLGDLDLLTPKREGGRLLALLTSLDASLGSRFWHVETKADENFNNLRGGQRYRLHTAVDDDSAASGIGAAVMDILVDRFSFCHTVALERWDGATERLHTIGPAELLITKLQYIRAVARDAVTEPVSHRVIGELGRQTLIGPEDKDISDAAALLADRGVGIEPGQIDPSTFGATVADDWKLHRTLRLNLANRAGFETVLACRDAGPSEHLAVNTALDVLAGILEDPGRRPREPRLRLSKTWWEAVEDQE